MKRWMYPAYLILLFILFFSSTQAQHNQSFGPGIFELAQPNVSYRSSCVPGPTRDYDYDFSKSFEDNINTALQRERLAFNKSNIGTYVHPTYYSDPRDYAQKIITALRKAYSKAYNIPTLSIPLHPAINIVAQNHSCRMIQCNEFNHQSNCLGTVQNRISQQVGAWGTCFNGYAENIAINTLHSLEAAIEWAIYGMMYNDLNCCNNGHRDNFLNCNFDSSWYLGIGFQKGKYNFGSNRSYDTWFMTWDYVKKPTGNSCTWSDKAKKQECPSIDYTEFAQVNISGSNGQCTTVDISWTMNREWQTKNFEVFIAEDDQPYKSIESIPGKGSTQQSTKYESIYTTQGGQTLKVFIKSYDQAGGFIASPLQQYSLANCTTTQPSEPEEEVTETETPTEPDEENEPTETVEENNDAIVVVPNPARSVIRLKNIPVGTLYIIYDERGRARMLGYYSGRINISRLSAGNYYVVTRNQSGRFVKL